MIRENFLNLETKKEKKQLVNLTGIAVTAWLYFAAALIVIAVFTAIVPACLMFARWLHG